ncbi:MAG: hypothetical protein DDT42_01001 [candidate division WS2 bacterium]|uniref:DUF4153 domain-containing protein n=1 Tax=Psychracetigena formicireducens TaxID=2986056 RepID=A0A9E2BIE2_PSYF1|nr:hypothetical protein [Candidatus Psychracetigena formicireducens]MBT9145131.1 hypothetical protein [Candidatus Psychracetigena formicireducens]
MFDLNKEIEYSLETPSLLEELYHKSCLEGREGAFLSEINRLYQINPQDRLVSAWYFRLHHQRDKLLEKGKGVNWVLVVTLSGILGFLFSIFSQQGLEMHVAKTTIPFLFLIWSPLTVTFINQYLFSDLYQKRKQSYILIFFLLLLAAYGSWIINQPLANFWSDEGYANHYLDIFLSHLPLLSWLILSWCQLSFLSDSQEHYSFFLKSIEVLLLGGILISISIAFITLFSSLFNTLGIYFQEELVRWVYPFVFGLVPVITVSLVYTPRITPSQQNFQQGFIRLIPTIGSIFAPLMLIFQVGFLLALPFNFWQPFQQRELLLIYNIFLLFTLGLIFVATPLTRNNLSLKVENWLRKVLLAIGTLSLIICLYAFSAIIYRTLYFESLTVNRFTIIGWNIINISLLITYLYYQFKQGKENWTKSTQEVLRSAMIVYTFWVGILLILLPVLF